MPKAYTEKERETIVNELRQAALESMFRKGVKGTTVEELVTKARIPKGTFYLFYSSKELLLYDAILQQHDALHAQLARKLGEIQANLSVDTLTELLFDAFSSGFEMGILPLMLSGELDILMRKLPDEVVDRHMAQDDEFFAVFRLLFPRLEEPALNQYSAAFRALFFTAGYQREIGAQYDAALRVLIRGLVLQMMEETA